MFWTSSARPRWTSNRGAQRQVVSCPECRMEIRSGQVNPDFLVETIADKIKEGAEEGADDD